MLVGASAELYQCQHNQVACRRDSPHRGVKHRCSAVQLDEYKTCVHVPGNTAMQCTTQYTWTTKPVRKCVCVPRFLSFHAVYLTRHTSFSPKVMTQLMMGGAGDTSCRQGCSSQDTMVHQSRARGHLQDDLHCDSAGSCGRLPCCAVLCWAVLCCAVLCCAALRCDTVLGCPEQL